MIPARSENIPPNAARINGVDIVMVDQKSATEKSSLICFTLALAPGLHLPALQQTKSAE